MSKSKPSHTKKNSLKKKKGKEKIIKEKVEPWLGVEKGTKALPAHVCTAGPFQRI